MRQANFGRTAGESPAGKKEQPFTFTPSDAPVVARRRVKRSQGRVRAGLLSNKDPEVRSAEVVQLAEGNTGGTEFVRGWPGFAVSKTPGTYVCPTKGPVRSPSGPAVVPGGRGKEESVIR